MPVDAVLDWLDLLRDQASKRGVDVKISPRDTFQIRLWNEEGADCVGKVRYSASDNREWEDGAGTEFIWQRFDRELERIDADPENRVVAIQLDVRSRNTFDPEQDHFLVIPEDVLQEATSDEGNVKIGITGPGQYEKPFHGRANNWHDLFAYATGKSTTSRPEPVSPEAPYYWVNQGEEEVEGEYLRAPTDESFQYDLPKLEEGDIVFSYHNGEVGGFHELVEPARVVEITPEEANSYDGPEDTVERYRVETEFTPFEEPLAFADVFAYLQREDVRLDRYYPVNHGGINQQYFFNLSKKAGEYLLQEGMNRPKSAGKYDVQNDELEAPSDVPAEAEIIASQLQAKQQLVFHGPPGTGKTYTAQQFARWWLHETTDGVPDADQMQTITFHPSFTYEDFIEGLTAKERDGVVEYRVESGVFRSFVERAWQAYDAADSPASASPFVLIIDEINRGNLANIFGEIITLLEKDKRLEAANQTTVKLPHSGDEFGIPPNLYVIGTMNTADRSIALVDAALRRRFRFLHFPPNMSVLRRTYNFPTEEAVKEAARTPADGPRCLLALSILGLDALNKRIRGSPDLGRGKQLGHTSLMGIDETASDDAQMAAIIERWRYEIMPLLEEYYFGQFDRITEELFDGGSGRIFDTEAQEIRAFTPAELARVLAGLQDDIDAEWRLLGTEYQQ